MAESKLIAVLGATGAQGGGLVRAICGDPAGGFRARAITRNVDSEKAKALAALGAELVAADADDVDSLKRAFQGAYGAFCLTNYWEYMSPDREKAQALALAEAARVAGVTHAIWSTLEDTRRYIPLDDPRMPTLMEKYKVPHFDAKGESDHYFTDRAVPVTFLLTSFYWDNFIYFGMGPKKGSDGRYAITLPLGDHKLPSIAAEDIGRCAYAILRRPDLIGKRVGIAGEHLSGSEMAAELGRALGLEVAYNPIPPEVYRQFGFPGADDLGNMFQFNHDFADMFLAVRSPEETRKLDPQVQTFAQWLARNKSRIPIE